MIRGFCCARTSSKKTFKNGETSFGSFHKKRYRYCGKERDEESGLYYYGARYYAAWTCRFVNLDPLAGSLVYQSPYCYAGNSPVTLTDVDGFAPGGPGGDPKKAASAVSGAPGGACDNTGCNPDGTSQLPTWNQVTRPINYATMATTATDGIQVQKPSTEQKLAENPNYERVYLAGGWNTKTKTPIFGPAIGYQKKSFAPPTTISEAKPGIIEILEAHLADLQSKPSLERITIYGNEIASTANTINDLKAYLAGEENTNVRVGTMADVGLSIAGLFLFAKGVQTSLRNGGSIPLNPGIGKDLDKIRGANIFYKPQSLPHPRQAQIDKYLAGSGGRHGLPETRKQLDDIATELENEGWTILKGAGREKEEFLAPITGGGTKGGSYVDLTAEHPIHGIIRINTVDMSKSKDIYGNLLPTTRKMTNATRIQNQLPGQKFFIIPKR